MVQAKFVIDKAKKEALLKALVKYLPELIKDWNSVEFHTVKGCKRCNGKGYQGKLQDGSYLLCHCLRVNF